MPSGHRDTPSLYICARRRRPQPPLLVGRGPLTLPSTGRRSHDVPRPDLATALSAIHGGRRGGGPRGFRGPGAPPPPAPGPDDPPDDPLPPAPVAPHTPPPRA